MEYGHLVVEGLGHGVFVFRKQFEGQFVSQLFPEALAAFKATNGNLSVTGMAILSVEFRGGFPEPSRYVVNTEEKPGNGKV